MELKSTIQDIFTDLNVNLTNLSNDDINLLVNQVLNTLYQVNQNIDYSSVYQNTLNIINEDNEEDKEDTNEQFIQFRKKLSLISQVKDEHIKNIE